MPFDFFKTSDYQSLWDAWATCKTDISGSATAVTIDPDTCYPLKSDYTHTASQNIADLQNRVRALLTDPASAMRIWIPAGADITGMTDEEIRAIGLTFADCLPDGWRRKYHREFLNADPDNYHPITNGSPTNGDKARNLGDGKVYLRSAGSWTTSNSTPDLVETADEFNYLQTGDIAGIWIVDDLQNFMAPLTRVHSFV